jgi:PadR family transcriptional regulator, regulatory protein PadR
MSLAAWQRASLPMLVLDVLAVAPRHGYGISQALASAGLQPIKGAQLYPALVRLEDDGAIQSRWEQSDSGPARKVYELTTAGRAQRESLRAQWRAFLAATEAVGDPGAAAPRHPVSATSRSTGPA